MLLINDKSDRVLAVKDKNLTNFFMSDIKTSLRELSVIYGIHKLLTSKEYPIELEDFVEVIKLYINKNRMNSVLLTDKGNLFDYKDIIMNGICLGEAVIKTFKIDSLPTIKWVGEDTQSDTPIDIIIGNTQISLKEESYILENMGLYKLVNILTGSTYSRGELHIFKNFAKKEYCDWFAITWGLLLNQINNIGEIKLKTDNKSYRSFIKKLSNKKIQLLYVDGSKKLTAVLDHNCSLKTYEDKTNPILREKVFSKWINQSISDNSDYLIFKKRCAIKAGENLTKQIRVKMINTNLPRLFRLHNFSYFYAKSINKKPSIYQVPTTNEFKKNFEIKKVDFAVPASQLNFYTYIQNTLSKDAIVFRNEIRFSHGQFNGIPEAKLYIERGSLIDSIYKRIYPQEN